jgi:hypothetical protein
MKKELPYCKTSDAIIGYEQSELAKSEHNDCVVRALASAYEIPYERAHEIVKNKFNRKHKKGTYGFNLKMNNIGETGEPINGKQIKILGEKKMFGYSLDYDVKSKGVFIKRKMTVGTFSKLYPKGVFIMSIRGHAFTIKDGVVIGNHNDCKKLKTIVNQAWQVI